MLGIPVQHSASQHQQCHTKRSTDSNKGNSPIARKSGIGSCCGCGGGCDGGDHGRDHGGRCYLFHAFCYSKRRAFFVTLLFLSSSSSNTSNLCKAFSSSWTYISRWTTRHIAISVIITMADQPRPLSRLCLGRFQKESQRTT